MLLPMSSAPAITAGAPGLHRSRSSAGLAGSLTGNDGVDRGDSVCLAVIPEAALDCLVDVLPHCAAVGGVRENPTSFILEDVNLISVHFGPLSALSGCLLRVVAGVWSFRHTAQGRP